MASKHQQMTARAYQVHQRLEKDLEFFCKKCLRIKLKEGGEGPFIWNQAQRYLHQRIEDQLRRTGRVRMLILKGRQQGISTYIAARFYHKTTRNRRHRTFILSHHSTTTDTLAQIVTTYHDLCPDAVKPKLEQKNTRILAFDNGSQYRLGTAGTGEIDRGNTNQYLHWSEVAFCDNTDKLVSGVCETVADVDGTEKLYESTANGIGNYFHGSVLQAVAKEGQYEIVFIPWYWQTEYRAKLDKDFELTDEEHTLKDMYDLDDYQIQWRRNKIAEHKALGFGDRKFKQEYPFTIQEAFQSSGDALIDPEKVAKARKAQISDRDAPLILGVDPGPINDRTCVTWRRGREWIKTETFLKCNQMELAGKLALRIDRHDVAKVFIDAAEGRGCADRLRELGYGDIVTAIPFAQKPNDDERYTNKRAEMAGELKDWLEDEIGVSIPDADEIEVELGSIPGFKTTSSGKLQMISKDEIKKTYGRSPDIVDSAMLTFAQPVNRKYNQNRIQKTFDSNRSSLYAVNRRKRPRRQTGDYDDWPEEGFTRTPRDFRRR